MHGDVTEHVGGMPGDAMTRVVRQRVGIDPTPCRLRNESPLTHIRVSKVAM